MPSLVTRAEVDAFMSSSLVRATYDDNNDGQVDTASLDLIIDTSEGIFLATLRGLYTLPLPTPIGALEKSIVLQLVHCQSIKRCPEVFRQDLKVCDAVMELLKEIRKGDLQLDLPLVEGIQGPVVDSWPSRGYEQLEPGDDS